MSRLSTSFAASVAVASLALLSVALVSVSTAPATAQPRDSSSRFGEFRRRFGGTWFLATSAESAQEIVDRAIERAVNAMNMILRPLARPMLRDNTPLNRRIVLDFQDSERLRVRFPDTGWETTTRVGRTEPAQTHEGDSMRVTQRLHEDGSLEQVFQADRGTRWNVYRTEAEGRMTVESIVQGDMMPRPMRFTLRYRRR